MFDEPVNRNKSKCTNLCNKPIESKRRPKSITQTSAVASNPPVAIQNSRPTTDEKRSYGMKDKFFSLLSKIINKVSAIDDDPVVANDDQSVIEPQISDTRLQNKLIQKIDYFLTTAISNCLSKEVESVKTSSSRRHKREWLQPEEFDGENISWNAFIAKFNICSTYNLWSKTDNLAYLQVSLKGIAGHCFWSDPTRKWTFNELVATLKNRYGKSGQATLYRLELNARRRGPNESLQDL